MATDTEHSDLDYPSLSSAYLFWEKAKEEYESENIIEQKDGCEKAFRASTEAIDTLLAQQGYFIPVGKPEAHLKRSEYLVALFDVLPEIKSLNSQYSTFKDQLHGICFYTGVNPKKYQKIFYLVSEFLDTIRDLLD